MHGLAVERWWGGEGSRWGKKSCPIERGMAENSQYSFSKHRLKSFIPRIPFPLFFSPEIFNLTSGWHPRTFQRGLCSPLPNALRVVWCGGMSCTCLTYVFWIHLHTWDTCMVRQSQCCSVLTALGVHEQPTRITMHYWQNQLQDSRGAGSQCCLHSWLQGTNFASHTPAWAAAGLRRACGGHLLLALPPVAPGPGLSKNHHRKYRCFLRDTGGKEEYLLWKHGVTISEASLEKQTCSSFPFFQPWRVFLKRVLGLGGV